MSTFLCLLVSLKGFTPNQATITLKMKHLTTLVFKASCSSSAYQGRTPHPHPRASDAAHAQPGKSSLRQEAQSSGPASRTRMEAGAEHTAAPSTCPPACSSPPRRTQIPGPLRTSRSRTPAEQPGLGRTRVPRSEPGSSTAGTRGRQLQGLRRGSWPGRGLGPQSAQSYTPVASPVSSSVCKPSLGQQHLEPQPDPGKEREWGAALCPARAGCTARAGPGG